MDETRQRRLVAIWVMFAVAMAAFALLDGVSASLQDALGLGVAAAGLALAALYRYRPELVSLSARVEQQESDRP